MMQIKAYVSGQLQDAISTRKSNTIEFRVITAKNQERHISQQIEIVTNPKGQLTRLEGTIQDITERKEQENKIRHLAFFR